MHLAIGFSTTAWLGMLGLRTHVLRTVLSTLGIICGVGAVVVSVNTSESARRQQLEDLAALGSDIILVNSLPAETAEEKKLKKKIRLLPHATGLTRRDAEIVRNRLHTQIREVAMVRECNLSSARVGDQTLDAGIFGTTASLRSLRRFQMRYGRFLAEFDDNERATVCVLEDAVAREAFPDQNPIGSTVHIDHQPFLVVGVIAGKVVSDEKYQDLDVASVNRAVYIPLQTARMRLTQDPLTDEVSQLLFQILDGADLLEVSRSVTNILAVQHGMQAIPESQRDFLVKVPLQMYEQEKKTERTWNLILMIFGLVALVVGGIGIMNIMLANVTERRREVGIRRALGATQGNILGQFLMESVMVCMFGGLLGCFFGVMATAIISSNAEWPMAISWAGMLLAVSTASGVGLIFGVYPAFAASRLDPIEALRDE